MNSKVKLKGRLIIHLICPVVLGILMLFTGVYEYINDRTIGMVLVCLAAVDIVVALVMYFLHKPIIIHDLVDFAVDYAQVQKELLRDLAVPYGHRTQVSFGSETRSPRTRFPPYFSEELPVLKVDIF